MLLYWHDTEKAHGKITETDDFLHKVVNQHMGNYTNLPELLLFLQLCTCYAK